MQTHQFECSICLNIEKTSGSNIKALKTDWKVFNDDLHDLPPGLKLMECQGCGSLGMKMIPISDVDWAKQNQLRDQWLAKNPGADYPGWTSI